MSPRIKRVLREPLVHFLAIGLLLFVLFALVNEDRNPIIRMVLLAFSKDTAQFDLALLAISTPAPRPRR